MNKTFGVCKFKSASRILDLRLGIESTLDGVSGSNILDWIGVVGLTSGVVFFVELRIMEDEARFLPVFVCFGGLFGDADCVFWLAVFMLFTLGVGVLYSCISGFWCGLDGGGEGEDVVVDVLSIGDECSLEENRA